MKNEEERTSLFLFLIRNSNFEIQSLVSSDVTLSVSEGLAAIKSDESKSVAAHQTQTDPLRLQHRCLERDDHSRSPASYVSIFAPISHLSNHATMCSSRSMRCHGLPARESSCDSSGKRTITTGLC